MKTRLWIVLIMFLFAGCSNLPTSLGNGTPTPDYAATDTANQIGTVVAARSTETAIEASFTPTPTPGETALKDLILTSAELNELANRWSDSPADDTANVKPEYCVIDCVSSVWEGGTDGASYIDVTLVKADSRDKAVTILSELRADLITETTPEIPLSDLVTLPDGTFIVEAQSDTSTIWGLVTRHESVIILIGLNMPDLSPDENILLLSLFADKQIQKLIAAPN